MLANIVRATMGSCVCVCVREQAKSVNVEQICIFTCINMYVIPTLVIYRCVCVCVCILQNHKMYKTCMSVAICVPLIFYRFHVHFAIASCSAYTYPPTNKYAGIAKCDGGGDGIRVRFLPHYPFYLFICYFCLYLQTWKRNNRKAISNPSSSLSSSSLSSLSFRCRFRWRHILEHPHIDNQPLAGWLSIRIITGCY